VLAYEDTVMSVKHDAAGRRALARQPLATLEMLLEHQKEFGPLYSWRGMTKALIGGMAQELANAEADLDQGCALSPERAGVWFLRGMHHLEIDGRSRGLPHAMESANGIVFAPPLRESEEERSRRERGLADLVRMVGEAEHDPGRGPRPGVVARRSPLWETGREARTLNGATVFGGPGGRERVRARAHFTGAGLRTVLRTAGLFAPRDDFSRRKAWLRRDGQWVVWQWSWRSTVQWQRPLTISAAQQTPLCFVAALAALRLFRWRSCP